MQTKRRQSELGFALLELLVVVLLIGILGAVGLPAFLDAKLSAELASCRSDTHNVALAVDLYNIDTGGTPTATAAILTGGAKPYLPVIPSNSPYYTISIVGGVVMVAAPSTAELVAADSTNSCRTADQAGPSAPMGVKATHAQP